MTPPGAILLVIPCFRESERLPRFLPGLCDVIAGSGLPVDILPVDDGSGSDEVNRLAAFVDSVRREHSFVQPVLRLHENQGKGSAVYTGWDAAREHGWLAFVDADGAVPAEEVLRVARLTRDRANAGRAIYAVRVAHQGRRVERIPSRRLAGHVFRWLVRLLFHLPPPDTQCGLKIIPAAAWATLRPWVREKRFCFDVELTCLLVAAGVKIVSVPIDWRESPGGKVRLRTTWEMFTALLRLRRRIE